jgi:hypothetical protein
LTVTQICRIMGVGLGRGPTFPHVYSWAHPKGEEKMSETFEYDVFISHSSKDKRVARALAKRLKADGLNVAWDEEKLEQARTLILCMSPAYFDSEWGTLEHHTLLFRDPTNAQRRFIPLLFEDCTLPDIIAQFAHIDWRTPSDEAYDKLLAACQRDEAETMEPATPEKPVDQARMVLQGHSGFVMGVWPSRPMAKRSSRVQTTIRLRCGTSNPVNAAPPSKAIPATSGAWPSLPPVKRLCRVQVTGHCKSGTSNPANAGLPSKAIPTLSSAWPLRPTAKRWFRVQRTRR